MTRVNPRITRYGAAPVKGWTGIYELDLPEPFFLLAYDAGLGSKNPQGFGMVEVMGISARAPPAHAMTAMPTAHRLTLMFQTTFPVHFDLAPGRAVDAVLRVSDAAVARRITIGLGRTARQSR